MKFIRSEEFSQKREQIIRRYDINYKFKIYKSNFIFKICTYIYRFSDKRMFIIYKLI